MQEFCSLCQPTARGIVVQVPEKSVADEMITAISDHYRNEWKRLDANTLWYHERFFYDCIPFWLETQHPSAWCYFAAVLLEEDTVDITQAYTWEEILALKPALWVDDIIRSQQIRMMYQPIVSIQERSVIGYEMLARVHNTDNTLIAPTTLFHAARQQSELFRLDRTCRIEGLRAGTQLDVEQLIFINFIPTSIYIPEHCLQTTLQAARLYGIDHTRVVFEVVETERVTDLQHLKNILQFYRKQGFRYALDDVGEGFNDIQMLAALEPDIVKLDRKFVQNIHQDSEKRRRADEISRLAQSIQAVTLAEGVETAEEAYVLRELGYEWHQGYYYGRPNWSPEQVAETTFQLS